MLQSPVVPAHRALAATAAIRRVVVGQARRDVVPEQVCGDLVVYEQTLSRGTVSADASVVSTLRW